MPTSIARRAATPDEQVALQTLANVPIAITRLKSGVENAVVIWAASLLAVMILWFAVGWLVGKRFDMSLGMHSTATLWVAGVATPLCGVFAIFSSIRWVRGLPDHRPQLRDDVAQSHVDEERYVFLEAKRFQEPEHGGLLYFLRSTENDVFTVYDYESQTLGVDGRDPLQSNFRPQSNLLIVRAPLSGFVLSREWFGSELDVGLSMELAADPKEWPEAEEFCAIPWEKLEERLGSG